MRRERLEAAGIDVETTLRRMGGRMDMAEKYWKRFLKDSSFQEMKNAENLQERLRAVHTLKGVSANLGMDALSESCASMVNMLRSGITEIEWIEEKIQDQYEQIIAAIEEAEE